MVKEIEVFTAENRPICKRCNDKFAALRKGVLAYSGHCSSCYQVDKTERRAAESLNPYVKPTDKAKASPQPRSSPKPADKKRAPGGYHRPKPGSGPTADDEVRTLSSRFGWCQTGHHYGKPIDELYPEGLSGLLTDSIPVTCPSVIWLSPTGEWLRCPCPCHSTAIPTASPELAAAT